jgi:hypothetical protein
MNKESMKPAKIIKTKRNEHNSKKNNKINNKCVKD